MASGEGSRSLSHIYLLPKNFIFASTRADARVATGWAAFRTWADPTESI